LSAIALNAGAHLAQLLKRTALSRQELDKPIIAIGLTRALGPRRKRMEQAAAPELSTQLRSPPDRIPAPVADVVIETMAGPTAPGLSLVRINSLCARRPQPGAREVALRDLAGDYDLDVRRQIRGADPERG
jgi:hypothetical protein